MLALRLRTNPVHGQLSRCCLLDWRSLMLFSFDWRPSLCCDGAGSTFSLTKGEHDSLRICLQWMKWWNKPWLKTVMMMKVNNLKMILGLRSQWPSHELVSFDSGSPPHDAHRPDRYICALFLCLAFSLIYIEWTFGGGNWHLCSEKLYLFYCCFLLFKYGDAIVFLTVVTATGLGLQLEYKPWKMNELNLLEQRASICVLGAMTFSVLFYLQDFGSSGRTVVSVCIFLCLWGFILFAAK